MKSSCVRNCATKSANLPNWGPFLHIKLANHGDPKHKKWHWNISAIWRRTNMDMKTSNRALWCEWQVAKQLYIKFSSDSFPFTLRWKRSNKLRISDKWQSGSVKRLVSSVSYKTIKISSSYYRQTDLFCYRSCSNRAIFNRTKRG